MNRFGTIAMLCGVLALCAGFTTQPMNERQAQDKLPQVKDAMWDKFAQCKVALDTKKYTYSITYTPEVKAMEGKPYTISGFMLPLEAQEKFTHFLVSKRTPTCPFCPPGEPNEIVEVFTKAPVKWDEDIVTVTGTMAFTSNPELGLFFQMKDAAVIQVKPYEDPKKKLPNF